MLSKHVIVALTLMTAISFSATNCSNAQTLYGMAGSLQARENAHNCDWAYNWGVLPNNNAFSVDVANYEFVPMIWAANVSGRNLNAQIDAIFDLEEDFGVHVDYVLGFNEPELSSQSNISVENALVFWETITDRFSGTDIKLVSPAVSGGGAIRDNVPNRPDGWLTEFMDGVEAANTDSDPNNDLQVDAIAYHYYSVAFNGTAAADDLIADIDELYERYGLPIWITEFAGTSFSLDNPIHSTEERQAFNREFLQRLIPQFDARPYVERVSWWQFGAFGRPYSALTTVSNGVYTPTIIGEQYMRTTLPAGQTYNFGNRPHRPTYVHYLKGSNLGHDGPPLAEALRAVDAMEGTNIMSGAGDWGFEDSQDAFLRVRSGALLRKQDDATVTIKDSPIFNEGSILITGGALQLQEGTELTGAGDLLVNGSGALETSSAFGGDDVLLGSSVIALDDGDIAVLDGVTHLSQELSLTNSNEIFTGGNLIVSGRTTGTGSIISTGPGTLFLNSDGMHQGGAFVAQGQLVVANTQASSTGSGVVTVIGAGTLGGFGQIDGNVNALGGAVAPGVLESPSGATDGPVFDPGVVVDALDFDFAGVQDDAPLTQTSTLASGLQIVSGLDFGSAVRPRGAANNGNEFNVSGFLTSDNDDAAVNGGRHLNFTIAPVEGLAMIIEDVTVQLRRNGANAATRYMLTTSIDGFTSANRWDLLVVNDTVLQNLTYSNVGSAPVTGEVEIRISGAGAGAAAGNTHFHGVSVDASFVSDPNTISFDPTGIMELGGNYTQSPSAAMEIDLGGIQPGEFDQLQVVGDVSLDGTLDVSMIDGFEPTPGQTFDIITANSVSGTFSNVVVPEGLNIEVLYTNSAVSVQVGVGVLLGDANVDGVVDFLDVSPFIALLSSGGYLDQADVNQDGSVDFLDIPSFIGILAAQ